MRYSRYIRYEKQLNISFYILLPEREKAVAVGSPSERRGIIDLPEGEKVVEVGSPGE